MTTSVENLKIHKTGGNDVTYAMGKKQHFHTEIFNGFWIANKGYPNQSTSHRLVEEFTYVLHTAKLYLQHISEVAVTRAPTIYSQINSSPEESE